MVSLTIIIRTLLQIFCATFPLLAVCDALSSTCAIITFDFSVLHFQSKGNVGQYRLATFMIIKSSAVSLSTWHVLDNYQSIIANLALFIRYVRFVLLNY
jgi:hypothetical protein